jgi:hypothetical protein
VELDRVVCDLLDPHHQKAALVESRVVLPGPNTLLSHSAVIHRKTSVTNDSSTVYIIYWRHILFVGWSCGKGLLVGRVHLVTLLILGHANNALSHTPCWDGGSRLVVVLCCRLEVLQKGTTVGYECCITA